MLALFKKKILIPKKKNLFIIDQFTKTMNYKSPFFKEEDTIPFTARIIAYYRSQENKKDHPLIKDPYAKLFVEDLDSYIDKHRHTAGSGDYAIVRSYYIENKLLTNWIRELDKNKLESQIVLLGSGLDTRAYRYGLLRSNLDTIYELDFQVINKYKEIILKDEVPLCKLVRISTDLTAKDWSTKLIKCGFSKSIPTFWILEGLVYYIQQEKVIPILKDINDISTKSSQIFVDICVPAIAELNFGAFATHFKWGLNKKDLPDFFAKSGWKVTCSFADDHDQGRDVGQRGMIFVHGYKTVIGMITEQESNLITKQGLNENRKEDFNLSEYTLKIAEEFIPKMQEIINLFRNQLEKAIASYKEFLMEIIIPIKVITENFRDPIDLGFISPRLLRDPFTIDLNSSKMSPEEIEAHILGYFKAILYLLYCGSLNIEGWQFKESKFYQEELSAQKFTNMSDLPSLISLIKKEIQI